MSEDSDQSSQQYYCDPVQKDIHGFVEQETVPLKDLVVVHLPVLIMTAGILLQSARES
jgi:hypothetical protein